MEMKGEVDHTADYLKDTRGLFLDDLYADVTLRVEGLALPAHKVILTARSDYFRALFASGMKECRSKEVEIKDASSDAFRELLRYVYTGQIKLAEQSLDLVFDLFGLAHKYGFIKLEEAAATYLGNGVKVDNVCKIYEKALLLQFDKILIEVCLEFMDENASKVLSHPSFLNLSHHHLNAILSRKYLHLPEIEKFRAVHRWAESQSRTKHEAKKDESSSDDNKEGSAKKTRKEVSENTKDEMTSCEKEDEQAGEKATAKNADEQVGANAEKIVVAEGDAKKASTEKSATAAAREEESEGLSQIIEPILSNVKLSLISVEDILTVVRPTGLFAPNVILDTIQSRVKTSDYELTYCRALPEENVVETKFGAQVIRGDDPEYLLDKDSEFGTLHKMPDEETWRSAVEPKNDANGTNNNNNSTASFDDSHIEDLGIVVKLGSLCVINRIRLELPSADHFSDDSSYVVDVASDGKDWLRVIDYSQYHCRSWQDLYFPARVVRYIRVIGTGTEDYHFFLNSLEAYYTKTPLFQSSSRILAPTQNVATGPMFAQVVRGVNPDALLNGDISNYDVGSGYTSHRFGDGSITVQLGQPYMVDSIRLLLWDRIPRFYTFDVDVSCNDKDWQNVCKNRTAQSWDTIKFSCRPVCYIRITGTASSIHNDTGIRIVHLECPAATSNPAN